MDDFLRFFDKVRSRIPMHIEIGYSSIVDWMIVIYEGRSYAENGRKSHQPTIFKPLERPKMREENP